MKAKELRGLNDDQLSSALRDTNQKLFKLRFQAAAERLDAPSEMRKLRKDVARIKTLQRERELATGK